MKVVILSPENEFTGNQISQLKKYGEITFSDSRREYPFNELKELCADADIIGLDPDNLGGFEKGEEVFNKLLDECPKLKAVCLASTSFNWINIANCKARNIKVSNIPGYSRNSVAEHTIALLLCLSKRIIELDRANREGHYELKMGFELSDKTLGIIGLGNIGSRVAELAQGIGMNVIAYNPSPREHEGVKMVDMDYLIRNSDAISLNLRDSKDVKDMINREALMKMKENVIIVNTASREIVDEKAMADLIKSGKVFGYAFEGEDLVNGPLANVERAISIKPFGWYTKESMENLHEIFIKNIEAMVKGESRNLV